MKNAKLINLYCSDLYYKFPVKRRTCSPIFQNNDYFEFCLLPQVNQILFEVRLIRVQPSAKTTVAVQSVTLYPHQIVFSKQRLCVIFIYVHWPSSVQVKTSDHGLEKTILLV